MNGILIYNTNEKRYNISFENGTYYSLHCGDTFSCSPDLNGWEKVRIEFSDEWYLINSKNKKIKIWENMLVKK